jgi:hypothetical protein
MYRDNRTGRIHNYQMIRYICFGFCFGVVMYRGHIIAQYKNIFDIADIYGERRAVRNLPSIPLLPVLQAEVLLPLLA